MIARRACWSVLFAFLIFAATPRLLAQKPTLKPPAPVPTLSSTPTEHDALQEPIKVFTEEVRIPVFAHDQYGHFDPTLEPEDVLVLEDGVPQQVQSLRRIPASVLLLLGTGSELNPAQRTSLTRAVAERLVSSLRAGDEIAVMQFDARVEILQGWTRDVDAVMHALNAKLHSGRGARLSGALSEAADYFQEQPVGNRHLVLVTDGVEMPFAQPNAKEAMQALSAKESDGRSAYTEAIKQLTEAQATVHVISYTSLARGETKQKKKGPPSSSVPAGSVAASGIAVAGIDPRVPPTVHASRGDGINFDPAMRRLRKAYERAAQQGEQRLAALTEESGGRLWSPTNAGEMVEEGGEVAREIGAQYVVTYRPKRPLSEVRSAEYRHLRVEPRRSGLELRARRGYLAAPIK